MIALVDYGSGNIRSVEKALRRAGGDVLVTGRPEDILKAEKVVLPGVGAFDDCLNALGARRLLEAARTFIGKGRPFLGICVGYQALFERSEEFNSCAAGLGVFPGKVVRFAGESGLKIPQIGWNTLDLARPECPLFRGIPGGSFVYFVHSYYPCPVDPSIVASWTDYGGRFASAVWRGNVFATQFHPEKSQDTGLRLLRNFVELPNVVSESNAMGIVE